MKIDRRSAMLGLSGAATGLCLQQASAANSSRVYKDHDGNLLKETTYPYPIISQHLITDTQHEVEVVKGGSKIEWTLCVDSNDGGVVKIDNSDISDGHCKSVSSDNGIRVIAKKGNSTVYITYKQSVFTANVETVLAELPSGVTGIFHVDNTGVHDIIVLSQTIQPANGVICTLVGGKLKAQPREAGKTFMLRLRRIG